MHLIFLSLYNLFVNFLSIHLFVGDGIIKYDHYDYESLIEYN